MNRRRTAGFTLLEVVVATLIMSIAVVGLMSGITNSVRNAVRLTEYDRAALLAKHKMDELQVDTKLPRNVVLAGQWSPAETAGVPTGWQARVTVAEAPPNSTPAPQTPILEMIDLQIWWAAGDQRKTINLQGFRRAVLVPQPTGGPPR